MILRLTCLFALLFTYVAASALTASVHPNQRLCFFADVDKAGEKLGFYFAVQAGGTFDIDFSVIDPNGIILLDGERERQGDYVFTANKVGEYSFCFENDMSTLTAKLVDFDIMVESEPRREAPAKAPQLADKTTALEESIYRIRSLLNNIAKNQRYFHTRENRGISVVESTKSRLFWYATIECFAIVGMAIVQVYVLQTFFNATGRRYKV